jgi:competence protein ComEC
MFWQRYPLFRLALAFCLGILWANFFQLNHQLIFSCLGGGFLALVFLARDRLFNKHIGRLFYGISTTLVFLFMGASCSLLYLRTADETEIQAFTEEGIYQLELLQQPVKRKTSWRSEASIKRLDSLLPFETKALLYLEVDSVQEYIPQYGDQFVVNGRFNLLEPPKNPNEFDYKNYLNLRSVRLNGYIPLEQQTLILQDTSSFRAKFIEWRIALLSKIQNWGLAEDQTEVSKALLLGYRQNLDTELMQAYSAVGAMHVLAVSGLHVGIVFLVLSKLLFFLRSKWQQLFKTFLLVLALWGYACISGLSPSVVRASTMFTFVAIGMGFNRNTSIYNTLLASLLFLLFIKPTYLFEVGFQLSYLAVFGIVWLQPKFQKWLKPQGWILKQLWGISTVSLAAQIATFPLGLYYFHQFPGLFLLSNLVVIPLVTILMYLGLLLLVQSLFLEPFSLLLKVYSFLLTSMNNAVQWIEQWEMMLIDQIHISRLELVLFYMFLACFFHALFRQNIRFVYISLSLFICVQVYQLYENYQLNHKSELVVYSIRNETALSFRSGNHLYFLSNKSLQTDTAKLTFHVWHHWWASNVEEATYLSLQEEYVDSHLLKKGTSWLFGKKCIAYNPIGATQAHVWLVDEPILDDPYGAPLEMLVLSSALRLSDREAWIAWAEQKEVGYADLAEEGAWQAHLN